jgi:hypothetical protein
MVFALLKITNIIVYGNLLVMLRSLVINMPDDFMNVVEIYDLQNKEYSQGL